MVDQLSCLKILSFSSKYLFNLISAYLKNIKIGEHNYVGYTRQHYFDYFLFIR